MTIAEAFQRGVQLHNAGQLDQAEQIYRQILQQTPNQAETLHLLGVLLQQRGQLGLSIEFIARAIALKPSVGVFHSNLAEGLRRLNLPEEAAIAARRAVTLSPDFAPAHSNLGVILHALHRLEEAESELRRALELDSSDGNTMTVLCSVLKEEKKFDAAIEIGQRAVSLFPNEPIAHNNLAAAFEAANRLDDAEKGYRKAIELNPQFVQGIDNLGAILYRQGNLAAAKQEWERALRIYPDYPGSKWNLGLAYLAIGDWQRGWPLFESRLTTGPSRMYYREYPGIPEWDGFPLKGKSILLFPEQGYGDVIQYSRFIPLLAAEGAKVILHMPQEMIELMKLVPGVSQIVGPDDPMPKFDTYRALMSLPMVLKTTPLSVPRDVPYINVDPQRKQKWAERLKLSGTNRRIGLAWSGRPTHHDDARRSIPFDVLSPLFEVEDARFFSLQKGQASDQLKRSAYADSIEDLDRELNDFAETAAAIANLDLVIAVDTAVAHLAGALGKPVWLLLAMAADYRWMLDREDTPWYPTMRLFRQKKIDDWADVVTRVRQALETTK